MWLVLLFEIIWAECLYFIHNITVLLDSDLGRYPVSMPVKGGLKWTQLPNKSNRKSTLLVGCSPFTQIVLICVVVSQYRPCMSRTVMNAKVSVATASTRHWLAHGSPPTATVQTRLLFLTWPGQSDGYTGVLCVKPRLVVRLPMGNAGYFFF